jgi:hypothetical protein
MHGPESIENFVNLPLLGPLLLLILTLLKNVTLIDINFGSA